MNLVHIGKISCLCLLSKCLCAVFMIFRASIREYILDLLPNRFCRILQISAKHCRLVSVPPLRKSIRELGRSTFLTRVQCNDIQGPPFWWPCMEGVLLYLWSFWFTQYKLLLLCIYHTTSYVCVILDSCRKGYMCMVHTEINHWKKPKIKSRGIIFSLYNFSLYVRAIWH